VDEQHESDPLTHSEANLAGTDDIRVALSFIRALDNASLNDPYAHLDADALHRLRNPIQNILTVNNPDLCLSIDLFLATSNASEQIYNSVRDAILRRHPDK
jgi:phage gp36-like protein